MATNVNFQKEIFVLGSEKKSHYFGHLFGDSGCRKKKKIGKMKQEDKM